MDVRILWQKEFFGKRIVIFPLVKMIMIGLVMEFIFGETIICEHISGQNYLLKGKL